MFTYILGQESLDRALVIRHEKPLTESGWSRIRAAVPCWSEPFESGVAALKREGFDAAVVPYSETYNEDTLNAAFDKVVARRQP